MYNSVLALNNQQCLICHKTKSNHLSLHHKHPNPSQYMYIKACSKTDQGCIYHKRNKMYNTLIFFKIVPLA